MTAMWLSSNAHQHDIIGDIYLLTNEISYSICKLHPHHTGDLAMGKKHRVIFSFDEHSLESLERLKEQGHYDSMAEAVRDALQINRALQSQAARGFTEIIVRNPNTKEERMIVVPRLEPLQERERT